MKISNIRDVDFGTPERAFRQGGVVRGARVQTEGGIVVHEGVSAAAECVIDALRQSHLLDGNQGSKADRVGVGRSRYEQALWLRDLFLRAGLNPVKAIDLNARGGAGDISDTTAQARSRYNHAIRSLGVYGELVAAYVCYDQMLADERRLSGLRRGLDRICEQRGI